MILLFALWKSYFIKIFEHISNMIIHLMKIISTLVGWWYTYPSEKYEFVSWDYYSKYMEKNMFQTTNQCLLVYKPWNNPHELVRYIYHKPYSYQWLLIIINQYWPLLTIIIPYQTNVPVTTNQNMTGFTSTFRWNLCSSVPRNASRARLLAMCFSFRGRMVNSANGKWADVRKQNHWVPLVALS